MSSKPLPPQGALAGVARCLVLEWLALVRERVLRFVTPAAKRSSVSSPLEFTHIEGTLAMVQLIVAPGLCATSLGILGAGVAVAGFCIRPVLNRSAEDD
uniref:Uncharacterized protein n=1 Tax=Glossina palpalis gambiensis TaxID=67801 RepID=A0A1B0C6P1_9MUSC